MVALKDLLNSLDDKPPNTMVWRLPWALEWDGPGFHSHLCQPPGEYSGVDGALLRGGYEGWMNSGCKALSSAQALSKLAIISAGNGGSQGSHYHPASCGALNRAEEAKIALPSKVRKTLPKGTLASDATTLAPWMNRSGASARGHHLSHEDKPGKEKHPRAACLQSSRPESKYTFSIFKMHENTVFVDTVSSIETLCKRHISITAVPFCAHSLLPSQNIIFPTLHAFSRRLTRSNLKGQSWDETACVLISKQWKLGQNFKNNKPCG